MRRLLFVILIVPLLSFGQDKFCKALYLENFSSLSDQINTYFVDNNIDSLGQNKTDVKFREIDSLIKDLSQLNCIDTVKYRGRRGLVMKTGVLMTDIIISQNANGVTSNYIIRLIFENYTKVVFIRAQLNGFKQPKQT